MKNWKRIAAMGMTAAMLLGCLSGCGGTPQGETAQGGTAQDSASQGTADTGAQTGKQEEPSSGSAGAEPGEKITLKWYMAGSGPQADVEAVQDAVDQYLLDTYNMNIDLQIVATDYANYPQKMQMIISSGEEFDICWTSNWNNNYYDNVNKNAYLELDELLDAQAPELKALMDKSVWDGVRVGGKIYGVPNQQIFPKQNYVVIVKEYADKYNLNPDEVKTLADLEDFFLQVKADNPDIYPFAASSNGLYGKLNLMLGYEGIINVKIPGVLRLGDDSLQVINQYEELDSLKDFYGMMYRWQQEGLVRKDALTVADNAVPDMKAGKHIAAVNATFKPGVEVTEESNFGGKECIFIMLSDPYLATESLVSSLSSISRTSRHPEEAMKLLNLVNTDPDLYNLLILGVEGVHYTVNADGTVKTDDSKGYNPNVDWMFGNQFNALIRDGQEADVWEATKKLNDSAVNSPALGFAVDTTPITNEIASISSVVDQYLLSLDTGAVDPAVVLPEFQEKLKAAGADTIVAEIQKQLDEWAKANQ